MRKCYFVDRKNQNLSAPYQEFIQIENKIDKNYYVLQRVENCPNNYVFDTYSCFKDNHFLRYYTSWQEQQQTIAKKISKQEVTENKDIKKKSLGITAFLNRKKGENVDTLATKNQTVINKSKKQIEKKKQQTIKVKVIYIQLEAFKNIQIPNQIQQLKILMSIIYLLAKAVHKSHGSWPNMIPVLVGMQQQNNYRFVKKGKQRDQQLINLFMYMMKEKAIGNWSKQMVSIYQMYKLNGDTKLLATKIDYDLMEITNAQYQIVSISLGKKKQQKAKIIEPQVIFLTQSKYKLPLNQFIVDFSYPQSKQVTLEHKIQDSIVLIGQSAQNFIIRYLKTFKIN